MATAHACVIRTALLTLSSCAAIVFAGCGKSPTAADPVGARPTSLAIQGTATLEHPGDTARLTAVATLADGTTRDVTADASWTTGLGAVSMTGPGSLAAVKYGSDSVTVKYYALRSTIPIRVVPTGAFLVSGSVRSAGGVPLSEVAVESSSGCGTANTTTDTLGRYTLPALGAATLKVELGGFEPFLQQLVAQSDAQMDIVLEHSAVPGDATGLYRLTVTASPSCTMLPSTLLQRTYDARVETVRNDVFVTLTGAEFSSWGTPGFTGSWEANTMRFILSDMYWDDGFSFIESIGPYHDLTFAGLAEGVVDSNQIRATFNGTISYIDYFEEGPRCQAPDHQLTFTRTGGH